MRCSEKRLYGDLSQINTENFVQQCRLISEKHFTRNRKMPLKHLFLSVPFRKGRTLYFELKYFKELFAMKDKISKPGYLKQRMKLNPKAFLELMRFHTSNFYKDTTSVTKWKDYIVLATDGSSCNVPLTKENVTIYGNTSKHGRKERPQIGISCLFDVVNRMVIDINTGMCKLDERTESLRHIDRASHVIGTLPTIYVFDRGYPSGSFFIELMQRDVKFVMRLPSTSFKREQNSMKTDDQWIDIQFDKTRINAQRRLGNEEKAKSLEEVGSIRLRFVKITLKNETDEYLVTNIDKEIVTTSEISELYRMRWGIETAFDDMKNKLQLENFTGSKPIIMEQDIYATGYLYNIMSDIMQDAEKERDKEKEYKYKMQINRNIAAGVIKKEVILLLLEENPKEREQIMTNLIKEIKSNILPVRGERSYDRANGNLASKYSNVRKRSF